MTKSFRNCFFRNKECPIEIEIHKPEFCQACAQFEANDILSLQATATAKLSETLVPREYILPTDEKKEVR